MMDDEFAVGNKNSVRMFGKTRPYSANVIMRGTSYELFFGTCRASKMQKETHR